MKKSRRRQQMPRVLHSTLRIRSDVKTDNDGCFVMLRECSRRAAAASVCARSKNVRAVVLRQLKTHTCMREECKRHVTPVMLSPRSSLQVAVIFAASDEDFKFLRHQLLILVSFLKFKFSFSIKMVNILFACKEML
jgi:hypothetical protein